MFRFIILSLISCVCFAQPIEFVVTTSIGGPNDVVTRRLVDELEKNTDLKFVIVNKPGASHNIGYQYIYETNKPTLFVSTDTIKTNYDKEGYPKGITSVVEPIFFLGEFSNIIFVNSDANIKNINDLIKLSKKREINFGHGGVGTYSYTSMRTICGSIIRCLEVPYKSGAPGMLDILTHTIDAYSLASFGSEVYIENPKFRGIMVFSNKQHPMYNINILPKKLSNYEIKNWLALFSKNVNPKDIEKINKVLMEKEDKYYIEMGLWYKYKNPKEINIRTTE